MGICDQLRSVKFSKGVAGYNPKEVDGFLADILKFAEQNEQLLSALQVKLDAYESRRAEIDRQEREAYRLLEAARTEALKITDTAKSEASRLTGEAARKAEKILSDAETRAEKISAEVGKRLAEQQQAAKQNADRILASADQQGKTLLAESRAQAAVAEQNAAELVLRTKTFEARFRALVADTVRALSELETEAPANVDVPAVEKKKFVQRPPNMQEARSRGPEHTPARVSRALPSVPAPEPRRYADDTVAAGEQSPARPDSKAPLRQRADDSAHDFAFAGGKLLSEDGNAPAAQKKYKPYDTVTVTYENSEDDFSDIRKIMESAGENRQKNSARFME